MTFVYRNAACPLYTRGRSRFGNNLRDRGYSLWMRGRARADVRWNTNRNWNSTEHGCTGHAEWTPLVYTVDLRSRVLTTARPSVCIASVYVVRAPIWYIAPRQSRETKARSTADPLFPLSLTRYQVHCIRYFKVLPLPPPPVHLIASSTVIQTQFIVAGLSRRGAYRART